MIDVTLYLQGLLVFTTIFSHHIRDASRRGLWIWGTKDDLISINVSYTAYLISITLLPLIFRRDKPYFCDFCHVSSPESRYSEIIPV